VASKSTWHPRWAATLNLMASWSEDTSSQYSALIIDKRNVLVSSGWNGIPRGIRLQPEYHLRPDKYQYFVHAEINCLLQSPIPVTGLSMYLIKPPCAGCAGPIIQAGISMIYYIKPHDQNSEKFRENSTGWRESIEVAQTMLNEAGIYMEQMSI